MEKEIDNLYASGKIESAIKLLIKKIDKNPQQVDNYLQLSTYLLEQGSFAQAQELLQQALHLVKQPQELYYNLAVCYYAQGNFDQALKLLNKIPNDDLTLYQKALVYLKLGQIQKALAYTLTIQKQDERTLELLGDIWMSLGKLKNAEQTYCKIAKEKRTAKVYFLLAVTVFAHNPEKAKKFFEKSKKMDFEYYQKAKEQYSNLLNLINGKDRKDGSVYR